jgi:hypothetical protein
MGSEARLLVELEDVHERLNGRTPGRVEVGAPARHSLRDISSTHEHKTAEATESQLRTAKQGADTR